MDVKFILKSDVKVEDIKYYLTINDWSEDNFDVGINFTNPLLIS
jgi:YbbR domain-containing protein